MGVDVLLYAEGEITDEQIAAADEYLRARSEIVWDYRAENGEPGHAVARDSYRANRVEFLTGVRYYGVCYERGPWADIYAAIRLMQAAFPHCKVYYGGDHSEDGSECTDEYLAEIWTHFLGQHGDDYRVSRREWMARI